MKSITVGVRLALKASLLVLTFCSNAYAQSFPAKQINIIVPSSPGASSDMIARMIGQTITSQTKAATIIEDKPGANGIIGVQAVLNQPADGHTLLFTTSSAIVFNKYLIKALPYDPQKDLVPIGLMAQGAMMFGIHPKLPFKNMREFVTYAKNNPQKLNFGYGTATQQLAGELFQQLSGTQLTFVPYKTNTAMLMAVVSGEIDIAVSDPAGFAAYMKSEQVRVLATTASQRMPAHPAIPTMLESDVPFKLDTFNGLFARRGTSPEALTRLAELFKTAAATPEMKTYLQANALDGYIVTGSEANSRVDSDIVRWKQLTQDAGVVAK